jgi:hypothetical protein
MRVLALVSALLCVPVFASAQGAFKWQCEFTTASSYAGGNENVRDARQFRIGPETLSLVFLETPDKAYVLGNNGASEVARVPTDSGGVQFIERTGSGALQLTAIDRNGNAAHSRSTVSSDGLLMAAQHYGRCTRQ